MEIMQLNGNFTEIHGTGARSIAYHKLTWALGDHHVNFGLKCFPAPGLFVTARTFHYPNSSHIPAATLAKQQKYFHLTLFTSSAKDQSPVSENLSNKFLNQQSDYIRWPSSMGQIIPKPISIQANILILSRKTRAWRDPQHEFHFEIHSPSTLRIPFHLIGHNDRPAASILRCDLRLEVLGL